MSAKARISATSRPIQAASQCSETCREGSVIVSQSTHGRSAIATSTRIVTTQRGSFGSRSDSTVGDCSAMP